MRGRKSQRQRHARICWCCPKSGSWKSPSGRAIWQKNIITHAKQRAEGGVGNRLDEVRAYADRQVTEGQLHQVRATLRRAQELLGALIGQDEPVDVLGDPMLDAAPEEAEALRESLWQTEPICGWDKRAPGLRHDYCAIALPIGCQH